MRVNKKVIEGAAVVIFALTITVTTVSDGKVDTKVEQFTKVDLFEDTTAMKEQAVFNLVASAGAANISEFAAEETEGSVEELPAAGAAVQNPVTVGESSENQPMENQSETEEPAVNQEMEGQLAENQPAEGQANENQLAEGQEVQPEGQQPAEGQPAEVQQPVEGQEGQLAEGQEVQQPAEGQPVEEVVSEWATRLMPNVEEYLNIRAEASEEAELLGKLRKGDAADIIERGEEWSKISSGSVEGYVKNEYCVFDDAAEAMAYEQGTVYATSLTGGLRVRAEANSAEETGIVDVLGEGDKLKVDMEAEAPEGWVAVQCSDTTAYVSAEYVSVELKLGKAISIEEERAAIQKAQEEAAKKKQKSSGGTSQKEAVAASYDDVTLLGALIQCEAGGESYEGQLAVGAVVMNRLRSGYAGSISGVIYQSGQFTPASSGALANVLARGVSGSCLAAAQAAIGGADNVAGATHFRSASSGQAGIVIGNHVFY